MQRHIAQNKFGQADMLFQQARFDESLALLDELDQAFPNSPNVMFPRARCLLEIGETNEALDILDELTTQYQHPEAQALKKEIQDAILSLTQPAAAEARHRVGPTPDRAKSHRSSSHAESAPAMSKGNLLLIGVTAAVLLALFATIILLATTQ